MTGINFSWFICLLFMQLNPTSLASEIENYEQHVPSENEWMSWSNEELEKQMWPDQWVQNRTPQKAFDDYMETGINGTKNARKNLMNQIDISYGPLPREKYDVYGTDLPESAPTLFWIHGGYWQFCDRDSAAGFAEKVHSLGWRMIATGYTLSPEVQIEKIQEEIVDSLHQVVRKYPNSTFVVGGHSVGAHLTAGLLTVHTQMKLPQEQLAQIKGLLLLTGIYDLRPLINTTVNKPLGLTLERAIALSPLLNPVKPEWRKLQLKNLVMTGKHDSPEFQRQNLAISKLLKNYYETKFWVSSTDDHLTLLQFLSDEDTETGNEFKLYLSQFAK